MLLEELLLDQGDRAQRFNLLLGLHPTAKGFFDPLVVHLCPEGLRLEDKVCLLVSIRS